MFCFPGKLWRMHTESFFLVKKWFCRQKNRFFGGFLVKKSDISVKKWSKKWILRREQIFFIIFPGPFFNKESESDLKSHLRRRFEENGTYENK